jgi:hypothetical protein
MSVKISELTAATTLDGTELVPIVQSGTTKRATVSLFARLIAAVEFVGASGATNESTGVFSVSRSGAGVYVVTLEEAVTTTPLRTVAVGGTSAIIATVTGDSATQFTVRCFDAAGAAADPATVSLGLWNPSW